MSVVIKDQSTKFTGSKNLPGLRKTNHVWNEGQGDDCTSQTVSCENADNANDPQTNWDHYWKMADEGTNELVITTMLSKRISTYPTKWTWPKRQICGELLAKPTQKSGRIELDLISPELFDFAMWNNKTKLNLDPSTKICILRQWAEVKPKIGILHCLMIM